MLLVAAALLVCGQRAALSKLVLQDKRQTHSPYGSAMDVAELWGRFRRKDSLASSTRWASALTSRFPRARSCRASRLLARREPTGGVAADRVAGGRKGSDRILVLNPSGEHCVPSARRHQKKLRWRIERGYHELKTRGWPWPLRRAARLPSSCKVVHRGLRIPDLRAGDDSLLGNSFHRAVQKS